MNSGKRQVTRGKRQSAVSLWFDTPIRATCQPWRFVLAVALLLLLGHHAFCDEITKVKIQGLKRTNEDYIMQTLNRFKGQDDAALDLKAVEGAMEAYGLFSEVSAQAVKEAGEVTLIVTVKEKVSFLPIPMAMGSGDGWIAGLILMDMNAFGRQDIFIAGGLFGPNLQMGMLTFTKPPRGILRPGFTVGGSFINSTDVKYTDFDNNTYEKEDNIKAGGNLSLILPLSRHFTASLGGEYAFCHFDEGAWDPGHLLLGKASLNCHSLKAGDWFTLEREASAAGRAGADLGDGYTAVQEVSGSAHFQFPIANRARLESAISGILQHNIRVPFQATRSDVGSSIIVGNFHSERLACARALCEVGIVRGKYAMLSMYGSFEGVIAEDRMDGRSDAVWAVGPSLGAMVYLKRIIFPAIKGGVSYNINQNRFLAAFSVGMRG